MSIDMLKTDKFKLRIIKKHGWKKLIKVLLITHGKEGCQIYLQLLTPS